PNARIQICSAQTLARRGWPEVDVVIVDEAHEMHKSIFRWMKDSPNLSFVGLSATPWARGLGKYYQRLIVVAKTAELIDQRFLCPFVAYAPSTPDLSTVKTVAGDYHESELSRVMDTGRNPDHRRRRGRPLHHLRPADEVRNLVAANGWQR